MYTPTTAWDRAPTDKELQNFYGKDSSSQVRDDMIEVLTKTIRTVPLGQLGVQYVKYEKRGTDENPYYASRLACYPVVEVVTDYGLDDIRGNPSPLKALLAVLVGSDCPLVQKYREALAERYADSHADEVEGLLSGDDE